MWLPVLRSGKGPEVFPMSDNVPHYAYKTTAHV